MLKIAPAARAVLLLSAFSGLCLPAPVVAQQPPPPAPGEEIIRISSDLVQTDVTVHDKQGRFVEGLKAEQFELLVDGKPQPVSFFEQVAAGSAREEALLGSAPHAASAAASAAAASAVGRGRTTFFFIDDTHLSQSSMKRTRELLRNYVDNVIGPKDQAVLATASGQLGFLQQATGDKAVLRTAIERLTYRPFSAADTVSNPAMDEYQAVAIENGDRGVLTLFVEKQCEEFKRMDRGGCDNENRMSNNAVFDDSVTRARPGSGGGTTGAPPTDGGAGGGRNRAPNAAALRPEAERMVRQRARAIAAQAAQHSLGTLASLESLVRTSAQLPERKLVVFISDGFFINFQRSNIAQRLQRLADAALRAGTVIYTIDARGLATGQGDVAARDNFDPQGRFASLSLEATQAAQEPLNSLAADTGGRAWFNSNDLAPGVEQALRETSGYYLLAWRPDAPGQGKENFRRIEVRVKDRPDLTVRGRAGYFDEPAGAAGNAPPKPLNDQLLGVIRAPYPRRGLPTALSVGHMFVPGGGTTVAAAVSAGDGDAELEILGALVNEKGDVISDHRQRLTSAAARRGRMVYNMQFQNVPPGLYQVRLAALDPKTGRAGSAAQWLEVPDSSKGEFALSSLFLSEVPAGGDAAQKAYVSADRRFARAANLRLQAQVFNAARASGAPDLTLELQLSSGGQTLVTTPPSPVAAQGVADLARIPLSAEFPLSAFPPGRYTLKATIADRAAKKSATQQVEFTVE